MTANEGVTEQPVAEPEAPAQTELQSAPLAEPVAEQPPAEQAAESPQNSRRHRPVTKRPPHNRNEEEARDPKSRASNNRLHLLRGNSKGVTRLGAPFRLLPSRPARCAARCARHVIDRNL